MIADTPSTSFYALATDLVATTKNLATVSPTLMDILPDKVGSSMVADAPSPSFYTATRLFDGTYSFIDDANSFGKTLSMDIDTAKSTISVASITIESASPVVDGPLPTGDGASPSFGIPSMDGDTANYSFDGDYPSFNAAAMVGKTFSKTVDGASLPFEASPMNGNSLNPGINMAPKTGDSAFPCIDAPSTDIDTLIKDT